MVRRVQIRFWLIAMGAMGFCLIALIAVINLIHGAQVSREISRALTEMVETVEAVRGQEPEEAATEWRVESFVEEEPVPAPSPVSEDDADVPDDPEEPDGLDGWDDYSVWDDMPLHGGKGKKAPPWWYAFQTESPSPSPEETESPTAEPEERVVNHYYYYYPEEPDEELDLRSSAMNQYAGRLCVVSFSADGDPQVGMSDSNALSQEEAVALAETMRDSGDALGDLDAYRYQVKTDGPDTWVYFLDCTTERKDQRSLLLISILVGLCGLGVTGVFVYLMSRKAIEPLKESMEKQKRFITDAGHELKTPLAVIGTNMDILEMDIGKNEWVDGTKKQLTRLRKLVANLISLSKLEEMQEELEFQRFCLSDTAEECVDAFTGAAELAGKTLTAEIQPELHIQGDVMTVGQLLTILCDNAVKYAAAEVRVRFYANGKRVCFETENDWNHAVPPEDLEKLFDRFYRGDAARSKTEGKSGHGLGLSIAKAIAGRNHAQLTVEETPEGWLLFRASFKRER